MTKICTCVTTWRGSAGDVRDPEVNAQRCFGSISSAGFRQSSSAVVGCLSAPFLVVDFLRRHHERDARCEAVCHQNDWE